MENLELILDKSNKLFDEEKYDLAFDEYNKIIVEEKADDNVFTNMGYCCMVLEEYRQASQCFVMANRFGDAGHCSFLDRQFELALTLFSNEKNKTNNNYYDIAMCYLQIGHTERGISILDKVIATDKQFVEALIARSIALFETKQSKKALKDLKTISKVKNINALCFNRIANIANNYGFKKEALIYINASLQIEELEDSVKLKELLSKK